ncbi:TPA: hypothetical protein EYP27_01430 [Candidatus Bathyarchaeota archaeon]|nr:hypothetical protein [Candidatus Bathyarchaeota archaeon]
MPYLVIWDFKHANPQARVKFWRWMRSKKGPNPAEWEALFNSVIYTDRAEVANQIAKQLKNLEAKVGVVEGVFKDISGKIENI